MFQELIIINNSSLEHIIKYLKSDINSKCKFDGFVFYLSN